MCRCVYFALSDKNMHDPRIDLDDTDKRLLALLQGNAHLTAQELGEALNLSPSQAGRRRQRLEAEGLITGYAARLDPGRLMRPESVAQAYWQLYEQPRDAWSFEHEIRPFGEKW